MIKKTLKSVKDSFGKKNVKTYLFFVAFTTFLWLALQFSKNYSQEVTFGLQYINVQKEKLLSPKTDKEIKMVLEGSGFQLLRYSLFKKDIKLNVLKASKKTEKHSFFTGKSMLNIIKSSLDYEGNISYLLKDSLNIYYDVFDKKELPIKLNANIEYKQGFISAKGLTTEVDKIVVFGPKSVLDTLKQIETKTLNLKNVHEDYSGSLAVKKYNSNLKLSFDTKKIPVQLKISELTEGKFKVPVIVKNVPKGSKVQLFPKQVPVVFSVSLEDYKALSAKDFKVIADLNASKDDDNNLILKLEKWPSSVFNARLLEKKVQYILIR